MLRAGRFAYAAGITGFLSKEELIGAFFTVRVNHQSLCRTIGHAKGATRAFLLFDEDHPAALWQEPL